MREFNGSECPLYISEHPNKLEPNRPLFGSCSTRTELFRTLACSVLQFSNNAFVLFGLTEQTRTCTVRQANSGWVFFMSIGGSCIICRTFASALWPLSVSHLVINGKAIEDGV